MKFWKAQAAADITAITQECEERIQAERERHKEAEERLRGDLDAVMDKLRAHQENIIRVEAMANVVRGIAFDLHKTVGSAFHRAAIAAEEIELSALSNKKLIKKHGEV